MIPLPTTPKVPTDKEVEDPAVQEPERPGKDAVGANLKWYPKAKIITPSMKTAGKYRKGHPEGAIVHFTAGQDDDEQDAIDTLKWGREMGYCFFVIGPTGKVYQSFPLDSWGYHAGKSTWPSLGSGVSPYLVGIEVACAGRLERVDGGWRSHFKRLYTSDKVRTVTAYQNMEAGTYKMFTAQQEAALIDLLIWLHNNNPKVFSYDLVLGHDEVSPGRKNDPGGALSMTMPDLRKRLKLNAARDL